MKNIPLVLLAIVASGAPLMAQPTLTASTNNPVVGDFLITRNCDTTGVMGAYSGAAQSWNYSTLLTRSTDTAVYVSCATTPFCDSFTGANIAAADLHGNYRYYYESDSTLLYYGSENATSSDHYQTALPLIIFPVVYNYGNASNGSESNYGTTYIYYNTFRYNAYGSLTLPTGTFSNVLMIDNIQHNEKISGATTIRWQTEIYSWYVPGLHAPALVIQQDTFGTGTPHTTSVYYTSMRTTGIAQTTRTDLKLSAYPNPASAALNFTIDKNNYNTYSILSCSGQLMQCGAITENQNQLDINKLPAGFYILEVLGTPGHSYCHFVKQ